MGHFFSQMIPHVIYYCCEMVDKCFISPHHTSSHSISSLNSYLGLSCSKRSSRPLLKIGIYLASNQTPFAIDLFLDYITKIPFSY
jgi:hypothetical protein